MGLIKRRIGNLRAAKLSVTKKYIIDCFGKDKYQEYLDSGGEELK